VDEHDTLLIAENGPKSADSGRDQCVVLIEFAAAGARRLARLEPMSDFELRTDDAAAFFDRAAADPARALVAMHFDGTLAPIVPDPTDSRLLPAAADALAMLGPRVGRIAIVTGRGVTTVRELGRLDERQGLENVVVLGQYGAERWDASTGEETPADVPDGIDEARAEIVDLLADYRFAGVHLEDKGRALGVHTRRAVSPHESFAALEGPLNGIAARHGLTLEPGRSVLELRASTVTKGDALRGLVAETRATAVAFCGDDLGDLPAFDLLDELAGEGVATCRVVSASAEQAVLAARADVLADGPDGVAAWLKTLAERLR